MVTFSSDVARRTFQVGDHYLHSTEREGRIHLPVEDADDAARAFASIVARRVYGPRRGYCHHVRLDTRTRDGKVRNYQAFIGRSTPGGHTMGQNIWLTVRLGI